MPTEPYAHGGHGGHGGLCPREHLMLLRKAIVATRILSRNILAKELKQAGITLNTVGHTEINAWGQNSLYLLVATKQR